MVVAAAAIRRGSIGSSAAAPASFKNALRFNQAIEVSGSRAITRRLEKRMPPKRWLASDG